MAEITNLRRFRKRKAREAAKAEADGNAVRHGRSKGERARDSAEAERGIRHLDGHRRETGEDD